MKDVLPRKNEESYSCRESSQQSIAIIFSTLAIKAEEKTQFKKKVYMPRGFEHF
jgi:hypothetical protein